jgi:hypothetical protein
MLSGQSVQVVGAGTVRAQTTLCGQSRTGKWLRSKGRGSQRGEDGWIGSKLSVLAAAAAGRQIARSLQSNKFPMNHIYLVHDTSKATQTLISKTEN